MFSAFRLAIRQAIKLLGWSLHHLFFYDLRAFPKRLFIFLLGMPLFLLLQGLHWIGFVVDELLFLRYRQINIDRPVFIVGIPRSGTTFLQRTLAADRRFTTTLTWECLFAPSIAERLLFRGLGRLLRPLAALKPAGSPTFFSRMEAIHELGLQEPEEDFLLFLPIFSCFIMIAIFPEAAALWRLADFDAALSAEEKKTIIGFYRRCLQKHLYVHGRDRRYLSKNPSFTSMIQTLRAAFPDGKIIATTREPQATVPSQLSSLQPAFELVGSGRMSARFQQRIVTMLHGYYRLLDQVLPVVEPEGPLLENIQIKNQLRETLLNIYDFVEMPAAGCEEYWAQIAHQSTQFKSAHRYRLSDFGLADEEIERRFADVWPVRFVVESKRQKERQI